MGFLKVVGDPTYDSYMTCVAVAVAGTVCLCLYTEHPFEKNIIYRFSGMYLHVFVVVFIIVILLLYLGVLYFI
tara:strand:- start:4 stop:222 length:219 start_codon:yes stop_codon:yes gene_type:complete